MNDQPARFEPKDFRHALGMFATGVTIVTTRSADGSPVGLTANSFNSVSLNPPLVLWSLAKSARSREAFTDAEHWNVHILAQDQEPLSNLFARAGEDKFAGQRVEEGVTPAPLLADCSARFQCRTMFQYEGGDHIIFVGEVLAYDRTERAPLLYVTGQYALASRKAGNISTEAQADAASAVYSEDMMGYLLGRAHYQFMAGFRAQLNEKGLSDPDFFALSLLSIQAPLPAAEIARHTAYTGIDIGPVLLQSLCDRGLLSSAAAGYSLTPAGRDAILHLMAAAKSVEAHVGAQLGEGEAALLRNLLKRAIGATDPGLPPLWTRPAA
jgi:3-hydroxy-9,10-secoandrosta-1,3,5(10)-triene-9,17-dione monooxygenase reductase component